MWNHTFAKFISQIIRLHVSFLENRIQSVRMDNAREFTFKDFSDYCLALGINGLIESLIKRIKFIGRPLVGNICFAYYTVS
jgi:hypothetical protein